MLFMQEVHWIIPSQTAQISTLAVEEPAVSSREIYLHDDVTSALIRRIADEKENLKLDALGLLLHEAISGPKMALNVPRPYNPVWEQDYTEAAHSLGVRNSSSRAIVHIMDNLNEVSN